MWKWQKRLVSDRIESKTDDKRDLLLLVQHEPVYTLGTGSNTDHLKVSPPDLPYPLVRTERGGEVTFHGPGQLVLYPILDLHNYVCDLHWYLRNLEEVAIRALKTASNLEGERVEGLTGVWVKDVKVAAIGVRARRSYSLKKFCFGVE